MSNEKLPEYIRKEREDKLNHERKLQQEDEQRKKDDADKRYRLEQERLYQESIKKEEKERKRREQQNRDTYSNNNGTKGCFPKGTKITTQFGLCDISVLQKGDFVISVNKNGEKQTSKILNKLMHTNNRIWLLEFSDGGSIRTTSVHSFLINGKWKKVSEAKAEDRIACYDADGHYVEKIIKASYISSAIETVYNIIVENDFNFIADGILSHSFTYFKSVRIFAWSLYKLLHAKDGLPQAQTTTVIANGYKQSV